MMKKISRIVASVTAVAFFSFVFFFSSTTSAHLEIEKLNTEPPVSEAVNFYNVRSTGARGDGKTLDTDAINKAIESASAAGGGTVYFPAGIYLSFSIRLKSNITLYLDNAATILAADPAKHPGKYDLPEPNEFDMYQDFGHPHWKNSLIWGIGIENVAIVGQGKIDGQGLSRRSPGPRRPRNSGDTPTSLVDQSGKITAPLGENSDVKEMEGLGTKAIALKLSKTSRCAILR
jgi:polygalacturonase